MIPNILDFLRKPAAGAAALRQKLDEIEQAIPDAEAEAVRLAAERAGLLLTAADKEIEAIERRHADARRNLDRLCAAREEISKRLAETEAEEAVAALDAEREAAEKLAAATADRVRKEYARAAKTILSLIEAIEDAEARVRAVNTKLFAAGRTVDLVAEVEPRALPVPERIGPGLRLRNTVSLRPDPARNFPGYGLGRQVAEVAGLRSDAPEPETIRDAVLDMIG